MNYGDGSTTGYFAVAQWQATHAYSVGNIVRQLAAPAVNSERCFRCSVAGTSGGAEPTWVTTSGGTTSADGTVTWIECTGNSAQNWSAPLCHLRTASQWMAAGDTLYVGDNHAEVMTQAETNISIPGTDAAPCRVICVNHSGSVPPVSADLRTTATITNGAGAIGLFGANNYYAGIGFSSSFAGSAMSFGTNSPSKHTYENCSFSLTSASAQSINISAGPSVDWVNCTYNTGAAGDTLRVLGGWFYWRNTPSAIGGGTLPTTLFSNSAGVGVVLDGVDLSALGSGKTLFASNGSLRTITNLVNCKLGASVTVAATPTSTNGSRVTMINCDSSGTTYRNEIYDYQGTLTTETTIVKTTPAGATDGTTPVSWKVVTTANSKRYNTFELMDIVVWCAAGARTLTLECITDNVILTNADLWAEVEYLGTSGFPLANKISSGTADQLAAGSNLGTSTATWTTTGLTTPKPQNLSVSFTTQAAGYARVRVRVAKASLTVRVDPFPAVT